MDNAQRMRQCLTTPLPPTFSSPSHFPYIGRATFSFATTPAPLLRHHFCCEQRFPRYTVSCGEQPCRWLSDFIRHPPRRFSFDEQICDLGKQLSARAILHTHSNHTGAIQLRDRDAFLPCIYDDFVIARLRVQEYHTARAEKIWPQVNQHMENINLQG